MKTPMEPADVEQILKNIQPHPGWELKVSFKSFEDWYLQVHCPKDTDNVTGKEVSWSGRKWKLSPWMCVSEVVRTAHKAVLAAVEHEANEQFKYQGVAIFDPHRSVESLVSIGEPLFETLEDPIDYSIDSRDNRSVEIPEPKYADNHNRKCYPS